MTHERAATPAVTVGPFFSPCLCYEQAANIGRGGVPGTEIVLRGRLFDSEGEPADDALIEIWQADAQGRYRDFRSFGRCGTDAKGSFRFTTIKPGRVPGQSGALQAPHLCIGVFARGLLERLLTRCYFADEPSNVHDPILSLVAPDRRFTLVASPDDENSRTYVFDIVLRGVGETVFFRC
jgi:protocatechuate 3,4-dioxygenase, alpha subunit